MATTGRNKKIPSGSLTIDPLEVMTRDVLALTHNLKRGSKAWKERLEKSKTEFAARRSVELKLSYPADLPISDRAEEISRLLQNHQVVVIAGETGSGKTTQLPKICLASGLGFRGMIAHTQPRRIAARSIAHRLCDEMQVTMGAEVGVAVRFYDSVSARTLLKVMTDGLLLAEIQSDPSLSKYEVIIVDEAHERSLNIDFLLGYLKSLLKSRRDLKLLITSATIDVEAYSKHFADAPVVEVLGRSYPVTVEYREDTENSLNDQLVTVLNDFYRKPQRLDTLVFLPGQAEIFDAARSLRKQLDVDLEIVPLYARLPVGQQHKFFQASRQRRVILATNIAETSLTVPNIGFVIDSGLARISRYSYRSKLQRLPIENISQASSDQRKGRCGRIAPGHCVRLFSEDDFNNRPAYTDPEIRRTSLAAVVLRMLAFNLGDINHFPFIDPPEPGAIKDARRLLDELQATDQGKLTQVGRVMARLPVDPRLGRMVVAANQWGAVHDVLIIVSVMAGQDPRDRPVERSAQADSQHRKFVDKRSDFMSYVQLWNWLEENRQNLTNRKYSRLLVDNFLSPARVREWRQLHRQLVIASRDLSFNVRKGEASYEQIHRSLIAGCLSLIGHHDEKGEYLGARNQKFRIFPGSVVFGKTPSWLIAAEIVDTKRVYARCVAGVEPRWLEEAAEHLIKRNYSEPFWSLKRGEACVREKVILYGLALVEARDTRLTPLDPDLARQLFIQHGLVQGGLKQSFPFHAHNLELVAHIQDLEARERRRDLLVDESLIAAYYEKNVPDQVNNLVTLNKWLRRADSETVNSLFFSEAQITTRVHSRQLEQDFPSSLTISGFECELKYRFAPGETNDGITLQIPLGVLSVVKPAWLAWLVPGMFEELCEQLLRSLPKLKRKRLAPISEKAVSLAALLLRPDVYRNGLLLPTLGKFLNDMDGIHIEAADWHLERLPDRLQFFVEVRDGNSKLVGSGRELTQLKENLLTQLPVPEELTKLDNLRGLDHFPSIVVEQQKVFSNSGQQTILFSCFKDCGNSVDLNYVDTQAEAQTISQGGLPRLSLIYEKRAWRQMLQSLHNENQMGLHFATIGNRAALDDIICRASAWYCFFEGKPWLTDKLDFENRINAQRGQLMAIFLEVLAGVQEALENRFLLIRKLDEDTSPGFSEARDHILKFLDRLFAGDFLNNTPRSGVGELGRYVAAQLYRWNHLQGKVDKDRQMALSLDQFQQRLDILAAIDAGVFEMRQLQANLEELRVALFAQHLKGRAKVSQKRFQRQLEQAERDAGIL